MRSMKCPNSNRAAADTLPLPDADAAAVHQALDRLARAVASPGFAHPAALTWDGITDYALALIRLRECACAAGFERLAQACDALALTVSRLIDERRCGCHDQLQALKRFVTHARAMIPAPAPAPTAKPRPRPRMARRASRMPAPSRSRLMPA